MKIEASKKSAKYWNSVADDIRPEVSNELWRQHADYLNTALLDRLLPSSRSFKNTLKTDLFDESLGTGLVPSLSKISDNVTGIDISYSTTLQASGNHAGHEAVNADILAQPFRNKSYDLIVSNSTLDHFSSDSEINDALKSLAGLLKPGGHFIWTMDNPSNPIVGLRNALSIRYGTMGSLVPYQMGKTWSLAKMTRAIRDLDLDVQNTARFLHSPRILVIQYLRFLKKIRKNSTGRISLKVLRAMEILERFPTRALSAHYNAVHAVRRAETSDER